MKASRYGLWFLSRRSTRLAAGVAAVFLALGILMIVLLRSFYSGRIAPGGCMELLIVPKEMRLIAADFPMERSCSYYVAGNFEGYFEVKYLQSDESRFIGNHNFIDAFAMRNSLNEGNYSGALP